MISPEEMKKMRGRVPESLYGCAYGSCVAEVRYSANMLCRIRSLC